MLVKKLVPNVGKGEKVEEIILSNFNYDELDKDENNVKLRLKSTAINIEHDSKPNDSSYVFTDYVKENKSYRVRSKNVILACYNMMIPYICLLYTSPSPRDQRGSRMPSSA